MKKLTYIFLTLALLVAPSMSYAGYVSDICPGDPLSTTVRCPPEKVGWFMQGITNACGNAGNCTLGDMMIVVANVGNFVLKIIGAIMLFMYVLGGFWYLASHGDDKWVSKGKETLKIATTGFLIVMLAFLGIKTLYAALTGTVVDTTTVVCDGTNDGKVCGKISTCQQGACYVNAGSAVNAGAEAIKNFFK